MLYDYGGEGKAFLPFTVDAYCKIPEKSLGEEYDKILSLFLEQQARDREYFFSGKLYLCYMEEMKTLEEDLLEGGNEVTREMCMRLWIQYRAQFREEEFSTMAVVKANPRLCQLHGIEYSGPVIF